MSTLLRRGHAAGCGARRACSTLPPSRSSALAATAAAHQVTALQVSRAAERRRFGVPVWQLLGAGFVGTCAVGAFWYSRTPARRKVARGVALTVDEPVVEAAQAEALMDEVRSVLERRGLSLGDVAIEVKLFGGHARAIEGLTVKAATAAPPPRDRKVTEVRLQRGLPALQPARPLRVRATQRGADVVRPPHLAVGHIGEGFCQSFHACGRPSFSPLRNLLRRAGAEVTCTRTTSGYERISNRIFSQTAVITTVLEVGQNRYLPRKLNVGRHVGFL